MFSTNLSIAEKYNYLEDKFKAGYKWLQENDIITLPVGVYPIIGEDVFAQVQEYTTIPYNEGSFETHEKFFDIQYVASGKEQFGLCRREGLVVKERIEDRDLIFYNDPELYGSVLLVPGDFIIAAPEDAHKPRLVAGEPCEVKKVVIKVRI